MRGKPPVARLSVLEDLARQDVAVSLNDKFLGASAARDRVARHDAVEGRTGPDFQGYPRPEYQQSFDKGILFVATQFQLAAVVQPPPLRDEPQHAYLPDTQFSCKVKHLLKRACVWAHRNEVDLALKTGAEGVLKRGPRGSKTSREPCDGIVQPRIGSVEAENQREVRQAHESRQARAFKRLHSAICEAHPARVNLRAQPPPRHGLRGFVEQRRAERLSAAEANPIRAERCRFLNEAANQLR